MLSAGSTDDGKGKTDWRIGPKTSLAVGNMRFGKPLHNVSGRSLS
jgi:hypothetical protein